LPHTVRLRTCRSFLVSGDAEDRKLYQPSRFRNREWHVQHGDGHHDSGAAGSDHVGSAADIEEENPSAWCISCWCIVRFSSEKKKIFFLSFFRRLPQVRDAANLSRSVCIISIVRLSYFPGFNFDDPSFGVARIYLWTSVES